MPIPIWNHVPRKANGDYHAGFDRRSPYQKYENVHPSEYSQWSPATTLPHSGAIAATEPGGGMIRRPGMSGMGDFFTYPAAQGVTPEQFMQQQVQSGMAPPPAPPLSAEVMDESSLFDGPGGSRPKAGQMAWETQLAPWEQSHVPNWQGPAAPPPLAPGLAPAAVVQQQARAIDAQEKKSIEAAQGAKVAADNALRAASAGAAKVSATNAATAQAAANVAAQVANTPRAQRAAAVAQTEATKAVAAANVAEANAKKKAQKNGMGDFLELSGMGGLGALSDPVAGGVQVKHVLYAGLGAALLYFGYKYAKSR